MINNNNDDNNTSRIFIPFHSISFHFIAFHFISFHLFKEGRPSAKAVFQGALH